MNPLQLLQTELDNLLYADGVHAYWQEKAKDTDPEEYLVYARNGDEAILSGDDDELVSDVRITLRYYYRECLLDNPTSRAIVQERVQSIIDVLRESCFFAVDGAFDAGKIDDTGYFVTIMELSYIRRNGHG
nr:MAG TPA: hypothetical protein [Caudoviricetes sp.]